MRELVRCADIITPNLTEACFLAGADYSEMENASEEKLFALAESLCALGAKCAVITGIYRGGEVSNIVFDKERGERFKISSEYVSRQFCGTGDLFSSLICGYVLQGLPLRRAIEKSTVFLCDAVRLSEELGVSPTDGVAFEPILKNV